MSQGENGSGSEAKTSMTATAEQTDTAKAALGQVWMWPIARLKLYAKNPRKHSQEAIEKMAEVIKAFGFKIPCLAKSDGSLIDGHLRLKAAKFAGITEVPVILCDEWTDAQVKAFRISVNRSTEFAEWDAGLLGGEFLDLKMANFDLNLTGFDSGEIVESVFGKPAKKAKKKGDAGVDTPETVWGVVIECADEDEQAELLEQLIADGRRCRALI